MGKKGKIRLLFAVMLWNVFLSGICLSALCGRELSWEKKKAALEKVQEAAVVEGGLSANTKVSGWGQRFKREASGKESVSEPSFAAEGEKLLALTFDDGPHSRYTKKLLDGLRERKVKVSFFLVGENIAGKEELVRQMAEDGHFIGVHCYRHVELTRQSVEQSCKEIRETANLIEAVTGTRPEYIRPPYGSWNDTLEECVEMLPVFWDIDTRDWESQNRDRIVRHIQKNAGKHHIILLHDVFESSVDAALTAVDMLSAEGYTFVTVDELLID